MVEKSYIDVNVFAYWLGGHPVYGSKAREWIDTIARSPKGYFFTSSLTLYEVAVILAGLAGGDLRDARFVSKLATAFKQLERLEITQLEVLDFEEAISLMEMYGIDLEDALHLATALRLGARRIVSNDTDFDRVPLKRVF